MGQKINPNIFRLGISKTWKTAYYESTNHELPLYIQKDSDFLQFIQKYFNNFDIIIHDYSYHFSNSTFIMHIGYFVSPLLKFSSKKNSILDNKLILLNKQSKKKKVIDNNFVKNNNFNNKHLIPNYTGNFLGHSKKKLYKTFKSNYDLSTGFSEDKLSYTNKNIFLLDLIQIINLFLGKNNKIRFCFNCINKDFSYLKELSKTRIKVLKQFKRLPVFQESIELFLYIISTKNTATLFAKFLGQQLQKIKRHNFFLKFIRKIFTVLLYSSFSKYKGIKIIVSGRLNGRPRSKHKIISIGDVPVTSIDKKIEFDQTFCHNSNGSYGIKVWMSEK